MAIKLVQKKKKVEASASEEKKAAPGGKKMDGIVTAMQKEFGAEAVVVGGVEVDRIRIPTGILAFDLATGGGIPKGANTIIYGPESSGKTNLAYILIAQYQRLYPKDQCVFVDVEGTFDPKWAAKFGVDTKKLLRLRPLTAEQAVDMVEQCLYAEDCGLVVVDSLAALVTANELASSAEKAVVGGASNPIAKMVRKTTAALNEADMAGRSPTLVYINQTRFKIGVMFGDPETMPGGNAIRFQVSLWLRVYGTNIVDEKVSKEMPVRKKIKMVIKKWKQPIFSLGAEFELAMLPHMGLKVGEADDYSLVKEYLNDLGEYYEPVKGKGWVIAGETFPTQKAHEAKYYEDKAYGASIRTAIIDAMMAKAAIEAQ